MDTKCRQFCLVKKISNFCHFSFILYAVYIYKKSCNIFKKKPVGRSNKTELCIIGAALQLRKFEGT